MAHSKSNEQIRTLVAAFVSDLTTLVREAALTSVQEALASTGGQPSSMPQRGRRRYRRRAGGETSDRGRRNGRRGSSDLEALQAVMLHHIEQNPGQRIEEIAPALNVTSKELALPVRKLIASKAIRAKGVKRATKYFAR